MKTHFVYRYESLKVNDKGYNPGPYLTDWSHNELLQDAHRGYGENKPRPGINGDTNWNFTHEHLCACASLELLKQWFRLFNHKLIKSGFIIVKYEVGSILETNSGKQLAFNRNDVITREIVTF